MLLPLCLASVVKCCYKMLGNQVSKLHLYRSWNSFSNISITHFDCVILWLQVDKYFYMLEKLRRPGGNTGEQRNINPRTHWRNQENASIRHMRPYIFSLHPSEQKWKGNGLVFTEERGAYLPSKMSCIKLKILADSHDMNDSCFSRPRNTSNK